MLCTLYLRALKKASELLGALICPAMHVWLENLTGLTKPQSRQLWFGSVWCIFAVAVVSLTWYLDALQRPGGVVGALDYWETTLPRISYMGAKVVTKCQLLTDLKFTVCR